MITFSYILANLAVFIAALVQASAGIGFAMIAVPLLLLIDFAFVPAPVLIVLCTLALLMTWQEFDQIDWQGMPALLPGMATGTLLAALLFDHIDPSFSGILFGSILLLALMMVSLARPLPRRPFLMAISGMVSGMMGTISGIHGPALAILYQGVAPARARATIAMIFVISSATALGFLTYKGFAGLRQWQIGFGLMPGLFLGLLAAFPIRGRLPKSWLRRMMLGLVGTSAVLLIGQGLD